MAEAIPPRIPSSYAGYLPPENRGMAEPAPNPDWLSKIYNPNPDRSAPTGKHSYQALYADRVGARPDDAARLAKRYPAPSPKTGPRQSPATQPPAAPRAPAPATRAAAAPAPRAPAPAPQSAPQEQAAAMQDFLSENPASKYDDDLQFSRLMMSSLQQIGDVDGYNQFKGAYADALTKRYKDVMGNAIISANAGDFAPALAAYNHLVPNNRKVVGYGTTPDGGLQLKFDDGRVETMSPNRLMGLMNAMTEPDNVLKLFQAAAEGGIKTQGKMAEQANQFQYDAALEQYKQRAGLQRDLTLEEFKRRYSQNDVSNVTKMDDGRVLMTFKNGDARILDPGMETELGRSMPNIQQVPSMGGAPAPSSGWTGSLTGQ